MHALGTGVPPAGQRNTPDFIAAAFKMQSVEPYAAQTF
jgi:hypothetical protein